MSRDGILLAVVLCVLALGLLYALLGSLVSEQWGAWIRNATIAAGAAFGIGMLLLGLPGMLLVEAVAGRDGALAPDSVWPLSILVTFAGSLMIAPASLAMRLAVPSVASWAHAAATAAVTLLATLVFTMVAVSLSLPA